MSLSETGHAFVYDQKKEEEEDLIMQEEQNTIRIFLRRDSAGERREII